MANSIVLSSETGGAIATTLGCLFIACVVASETNSITEKFGNVINKRENFYEGSGPPPAAKYKGPTVNQSMGQGPPPPNSVGGGDQLLSYKLYQQAVNAATPTQQQLESISGQSQQQTGSGGPQAGLSASTAPNNLLSGGGLHNSEFQAVNFSNERAQSISSCAQNSPTFIATSLLPKPEIPGQASWDVNAPTNILANQNFLSATQQVGVDTVLSSLRNSSYDIRNNIVNPINVVSPWMNTSITPDLERRPIDCNSPQNGLYGCGPSGSNTLGTYVNK